MSWRRDLRDLVGPIAPEFQTEVDLPDRIRLFGHENRKRGYSSINPLARLDDQRAWLSRHKAVVHEFFEEDWQDVRFAMEDAFGLGKMKPWHLIAYRFDKIDLGTSSDYPNVQIRKRVLLVFSRETDWLMFKMCL